MNTVVVTKEIHEQEMKRLQRTILNLSYKIGKYAPPMKPFIRFSKEALDYTKNKGAKKHLQFLWDFDYSLQQILLRCLYAVSKADEVCDLCVEQWKYNLRHCYVKNKKATKRAIEDKIYHCGFTKRTKLILKKLMPASRLLYIGCGSGTECLSLAKEGFRVVGIDTNRSLVNISNYRAKLLGLPFKAICMDLTKLNFKPKSFDSFLLEFYGSWPLLSQTLSIQRKLANVLRENGRGIIVACRKKYASFWFQMNSFYSPFAITRWLAPQSDLDFHFSNKDTCEERIIYGLYNRCHTTRSLRYELNNSFDVLKCMYEAYDPRYVIAIVRPKRKKEYIKYNIKRNNEPKSSTVPTERIFAVERIIAETEKICCILESHAGKLSAFFEGIGKYTKKNPLLYIKTDIAGFIEGLKSIKELDVARKDNLLSSSNNEFSKK
ncbi:MAG: class I SAM-dependent methyltransferase [Candidatus Omnitrophica bacterium]|nr:class I SAM-dependent methyltransferase [Candidatus Omnitrophota bacterium]